MPVSPWFSMTYSRTTPPGYPRDTQKRPEKVQTLENEIVTALANRAGAPCSLQVRASGGDCGTDRQLQNEWAFRIIRRLRPHVLDAPLPFAAKEVETETILCWIGRGDESRAEGDPLRGVDQAFEYRVLHTLAAIFAESRYAP
jgi:hypothetical protein